MLQSLHVKNLALIDKADVQFEEGLNILTGETGAGKSIILGSINLALGGRYTGDIIRHGAEYGFVELVFYIKEDTLKKQLIDMDIYPEDDMLILSRRLMEGRSISKINGETVSIGQIKEVAAILIDIHGQHEHQSLLHKKNHLAILDAYGKSEIEEIKKQVAVDYQCYKSYEGRLKEALMDESARKREVSLLEHEVNEISDAALALGEDTELEKQYLFMSNAKKIKSSAEDAYRYTSGDSAQNASDLLTRSIKSLQDTCNYDEHIHAMLGQLIEVDGLLNDFNRELADYMKTMEFSEQDYDLIESRLNQINRLKSKYGNTIEEILEYKAVQEERLTLLADFDSYKASLKKEFENSEKCLLLSTKKLTKHRKSCAALLQKKIQEGVSELNFSETIFIIKLSDTERYSVQGRDDVEFLVSMNPGEAVRPLKEVASGGELSRIMLAIKASMADKDEIFTLIFDEIDVGISGRTAQKVSEKMALIGKQRQVICITHLAQIAAMADAHYLIEKNVIDNITQTNIQILNEENSIKEIARILGGAEITDKIIESACEMKQLAIATK